MAPDPSAPSVAITSLDQLMPGTRARVAAVGGSPPLRRRLLDLGVVSGALLVVEAVAPLGDPIEIAVKGYRLSLRKREAAEIRIEVVP